MQKCKKEYIHLRPAMNENQRIVLPNQSSKVHQKAKEVKFQQRIFLDANGNPEQPVLPKIIQPMFVAPVAPAGFEEEEKV